MLVEDPDYLAFAKEAFADDPTWLRKLEQEWNKQCTALAMHLSEGALFKRQAG